MLAFSSCLIFQRLREKMDEDIRYHNSLTVKLTRAEQLKTRNYFRETTGEISILFQITGSFKKVFFSKAFQPECRIGTYRQISTKRNFVNFFFLKKT